jgi:hypothetical protein
VGHRAVLDIEATGKIISPLHEIEPRSPGRSARRQTLYCLSYQTPSSVLACVAILKSVGLSTEIRDVTPVLYLLYQLFMVVFYSLINIF